MPRKSATSDEKGRGSSSTLEAVKQFLQSGIIPQVYTKNDKRALLRRAKSFVLIQNELYFTGGRSRHNRGLTDNDVGGAENPENEPDHTQVLRKVVFSEDEQQEIINKAHIEDDGSHNGMEKTTEKVSNHYYWMGIIYRVRNTIHACLNCSSRSRNTGHKVNFESGIPSYTAVEAANASSLKSSDVSKIFDELMEGEADYDADTGDMNVQNELNEFDPVESQPDKAEAARKSTDVFTVTKEVCNHFWQKVEIQIFGPFQAGKKQVYVTVALDSYSQFPEAITMEVLSSATLTNFFLNLFCRYGVMDKVLLLQNSVTKNKDLYINLHSLVHAGISPSFLCPKVNPLDERWNHIEKSLSRFVGLYPDFWFHCLEAFMVPLRITLPPEAVYTPCYLAYGRELAVPDKLSQHYSVNSSRHSEIQLTEDQEKQVVDTITSAYGVHSENPSIPSTISNTSYMKESMQPNFNAEERMSQFETKSQEPKGNLKRRRGRPRLSEIRLTNVLKKEKEEPLQNHMNITMEDDPRVQFETGSDAQDDSDRETTFSLDIKPTNKNTSSPQPTRVSTRKRKATHKAQESDLFVDKNRTSLSKLNPSTSTQQMVLSSDKDEVLVQQQPSETSLQDASEEVVYMEKKHKALFPRKYKVKQAVSSKRRKDFAVNSASTDVFGMPDLSHVNCTEPRLTEQQSLAINTMQQLPLDTFYFILKQYLQLGAFPCGMSDHCKQLVSQRSSLFHLKDGNLHSSAGKSTGRLIIMREKARISLLRKAHARGETHHNRTSVLKYLTDLNVFWNGMSLDVDAFIHSCPECISVNPLGNMSVVRIPSKSASLSAEGRMEDEPHFSEDEEEESSYEDLIQYLTDNTFPPTTTPEQQSRIQQRSQSFCIINGSLCYHNESRTAPRQVLFSEPSKHSAIKEAHIENEHHLSQQDTQARLRGQYFWSGMTFDVLKGVMSCCMGQALSTPPVLHRNPVIQERVDKFRTYYTEGILELDTNAITASEMKVSQSGEKSQAEPLDGESLLETSISDKDTKKGACSSAECDRTTTSKTVDIVVIRAVENIVEDICKSLQDDKRGETAENREGNTIVQSPLAQVRGRKDAHKCQYCGKFISGNVAYRIHMYKHTGVKPFSCTDCGKSFTTTKSLQVHRRKHTGVKPYLCNQCGREFFRATSFKYHLKTHSRAQVKPLPCDKCNREFLSQNRLDKHKQFKHPAQPKLYICEHCGKTFVNARSLKTHEQSHVNQVVKYTCGMCNKDYSRLDLLEAHNKSVHPENEQKSPLDVHVQSHSQAPLFSHILHTHPQAQLMQHMDIATSVSGLQWSDMEAQQAARHIIITEGASGQITISGHPDNAMEHVGNQITIRGHPDNVVDQIGSQITIRGHPDNVVDQIGSQITIRGHPDNVVDQIGSQITIREHPDNTIDQIGNQITTEQSIEQMGSHITISEQGGSGISMGDTVRDHIAIIQHTGNHAEQVPVQMSVQDQVVSMNQTEVKPDLEAYRPALSQPSHTTVRILTPGQLPLVTSQAPPAQQAPVTTSVSHLQTLQHGLLQQEALPVQYEVECLDGSSLTEDDLNAVHLLAQASILH